MAPDDSSRYADRYDAVRKSSAAGDTCGSGPTPLTADTDTDVRGEGTEARWLVVWLVYDNLPLNKPATYSVPCPTRNPM